MIDQDKEITKVLEAEIKVEKKVYGWSTKTDLPIQKGKVMRITTAKTYSGHLESNVICGQLITSRGVEEFIYAPFDDYTMVSRRVIGKRITAHAVAEQHGKVLREELPELCYRANSFYSHLKDL